MRGHRSLDALCEGGDDGHRVHSISSYRLLVCHLSVDHLSVDHLSASHRAGLNQAHSSEYTYPHPYPLYQRFHPLATLTGGDRDPGPCHDLYIHAGDLISIHPLLPKSEKTEDNPAAVISHQGVNVTTQVSDHLDAVDSSGEHTRSCDEARHFDGIGSCHRNYRCFRMACCLRLQAHRLQRTLLVPAVDLVLVLPLNGDLVHVILRMWVGRLDSQEEDSR